MEQKTKQISLERIYQKLIDIETNVKKLERIEQHFEDLEFARQTSKAWAEIDSGKGITLTKDKFLEELETW